VANRAPGGFSENHPAIFGNQHLNPPETPEEIRHATTAGTKTPISFAPCKYSTRHQLAETAI
jgi:hypothetical protein